RFVSIPIIARPRKIFARRNRPTIVSARASSLQRRLHLNLDDAWPNEQLGLSSTDLRNWGPQLRFSAPPSLVEKFYRECGARFGAFNVYGSGDFHHLSALLVRRVKEPVVLVSFDNHPDWDIRPPKWC